MLKRQMLIAIAAALAVGCGSSAEPDVVGPGHEISTNFFDFWFAHNPETLTYGREIGGAFDEECRLTIYEDVDGDGMLDEVWTVWCSDDEREIGSRIVATERVETYEAESGTMEDGDRHCRLHMNLAPTGASVRMWYSNAGVYGPEVNEMTTFFMALFDAYPRPD
jgi:hypothetical protein